MKITYNLRQNNESAIIGNHYVISKMISRSDYNGRVNICEKGI